MTATNAAIEEWFAARTFDAAQVPVDALVERKRGRDLSVSVVVPSRNEAATIEGVLEAIGGLLGRLVDEIVVVDAGSRDGTREIARNRGARVHDDAAILPEYGPSLGKGDALWRSLAVTSGDVVAFVDSDVQNPGPHFVYGLLQPLIDDPGIQLTKAFYDRPIVEGGQLQRGGGGRVTELQARPLLNLYWPPLSGLVQPLAGEYAGRRALLESIPFFTGYGVELGMLVDTLETAGMDAIAQVDVGERIHRNQPIDALSRMAFAIAQVALHRFGDRDVPRVAEALERSTYVQFARDDAGHVVPERHEVLVVERPAHNTLGPAGR